MNKHSLLFNLHEAQEHIDSIVKHLQYDDAYDEGNLAVDMQHLYHHINFAWNTRNESEQATDECSDENFQKWRQFPTNIHL